MSKIMENNHDVLVLGKLYKIQKILENGVNNILVVKTARDVASIVNPVGLLHYNEPFMLVEIGHGQYLGYYKIIVTDFAGWINMRCAIKTERMVKL